MKFERISEKILFATQRYKRDYQGKQIAFRMVNRYMQNYINVKYRCAYAYKDETQSLYRFHCCVEDSKGKIIKWYGPFAEIKIEPTGSNIFPFVCDITINESQIKM